MEIPTIRLSPENFVAIALLSAAAYLGVIGAGKALSFAKSKVGA